MHVQDGAWLPAMPLQLRPGLRWECMLMCRYTVRYTLTDASGLVAQALALPVIVEEVGFVEAQVSIHVSRECAMMLCIADEALGC